MRSSKRSASRSAPPWSATSASATSRIARERCSEASCCSGSARERAALPNASAVSRRGARLEPRPERKGDVMQITITDNGPSLYPGVRYTAVSSEWDLGDPVGHGDTPELAEGDLMEIISDCKEACMATKKKTSGGLS